MTKPLHAGKAAMNGLIAARLAARDFTARADAIEAAQGFAATQAPGFKAAAMRPDPKAPMAVEENLFKYHAACYLTHSPIEAIRELKRQHNIGPDDMKAMTVHVDPGHLKVCDIPEPKTGLEIKFSMRHLAGMALDGVDTAALGTYSDENANDPRYVAIRERIKLDTDAAEAPAARRRRLDRAQRRAQGQGRRTTSAYRPRTSPRRRPSSRPSSTPSPSRCSAAPAPGPRSA